MLRFVILVVALAGLGMPVLAEPYVSIATSADKKHAGIGFGATSQDAQKNAVDQCKEHGQDDCTVDISMAGGCVALATDHTNMRSGIGINTNEEEAKKAAISQCHDGGRYSGCTVEYQRCAGN